MPRPFSKTYASYQDWTSNAPPTAYKRQIQRFHALHPDASLGQLRRHPGRGQRAIGGIQKRPVHRREWAFLTPREKEFRIKSLKVIAQIRREGQSLTSACREGRISPQTVRRYTNAVKNIDGRWKPTAYDRIGRVMLINENGRGVWVTVKDSRYASMIGRYHSAVRQFLETGDESFLKPFKGKRIKDANGNWHTLETDPEKLYDIAEQREEEEFFTIYGG
jgi:hypothetical protein